MEGDAGLEPDDGNWQILDFERAFTYWKFANATDWKVLPESGGFFEQDEKLMNSIQQIQWLYTVRKMHYEATLSVLNSPTADGTS